MSESMFIRLFAGISEDCFGAIPLVPFGQWLFPVGIFLLVMGFRAERNKKAEILILYRYGTILNWWKRHFTKWVAWGIYTAILLLLDALLYDIAVGRISVLSVELVLKSSVLGRVRIISMAALFGLLELFPVRRFVPGALLLLEGVTFIIGFRICKASHAMYGMWGMYLRSSWWETGGFPVGTVIAAEIGVSAVSFCIGRNYLKKSTNII